MDKIKVTIEVGKITFNTEEQEYHTKITVRIYSPDSFLPEVCRNEDINIAGNWLTPTWGNSCKTKDNREQFRERCMTVRSISIEGLREKINENIEELLKKLQNVINNNRENIHNADAEKTSLKEYYL